MKILLILNLLIFGLFQPTSFAGALDKTDTAREGLQGPVKNVHIEIAKITAQDGKWIEEDPPMPWLSSTYDPAGHRIEEAQIYREQSLDFTSIFTRDARGALIEGVEYDAKKNIAFKWTYTHDAASGVSEEKRSTPDGTFFSRTTYRYDLPGNLVEENRFPLQNNNHFRWEYKYDDAGRMIEEFHYMIRSNINPEHVVKSLNTRRVFVYNRKGVLTEETRYNGLGEIMTKKRYKYEYDKIGNWISQTASESLRNPGKRPFVLTEVTYRKITYHE